MSKLAWGGANYSTTEQVIGTWIDGKPLYQKTVDCGTLPNASTKTIAHNVSNIGVVMYLEGYAYDSSDYIYFNYPHGTAVGQVAFVTATVGNTYINIKTLTNLTAFTESCVTIRYTKTTD